MGHWYTKEGEAMHWVTGANGKERDTTLRDARKLNLLPSVTEILNVAAKPGLENWKQNQVLLAALTTLRPEGISDDEFLKIVRQDAKEQAETAKLRGSLIHDCLETIVKDDGRANEFDDDVREIARLALLNILRYCEAHRQDFIPEKTVAGNGYGGMIDLHNDDFVIDWKTKDDVQEDTRYAYDDHAMQLAAYNVALNWCGEKHHGMRRCINVFIDRQEPGKVVIHEWKPEEIELAWQKFELLLKYWQLSKNYSPEL